MIGWVCKFTPVEALKAMGAKPVRIDPSVTNFDEADAKMHPNICSYTKGVLETFASANYEGIVLTNCCDSIRRLYDVLKAEYPDKFICLLDLPRKLDDSTAALYAAQGLPCLFRVPSSLPPGLDAALDAHGYAPPEGETSVRAPS